MFNVALNLMLIPKFGYVGASIATFFTEILLFLFYYWYVSRALVAYNFLPMLVKPAIAVSAMLAFLLYFELRLSLFALIFASTMIYFAVIFLLKTFDREDYGIINKILKKAD